MNNNITNKHTIFQFTYCNYNYGSVLQCYATQQYMIEKGYTIALVRRKYGIFERVIKSICRRGSLFIKKIVYPEIKEAIKSQQKSTMSSKNSISKVSINEIIKFCNDRVNTVQINNIELMIKCHEDSCLFCLTGSDQVWNANRTDNDNTYFLPFAPKNKRIAFAPSFGSDHVPTYNYKRFKKYLMGFHKISVRESSGCQIVNEIVGLQPSVLLDPVFLLSYKKWEVFAEKSEISLNGKCVFCFFLDEPSKKALDALSYYKNQKYRLISLGYKYDSLNRIEVEHYEGSPLDFVSIIIKAAVILTDSFHATAFSLISGKCFTTYERNYQGNNQSVRITDILNCLNMGYRYDPDKPCIYGLTELEKTRIQEMIKTNLINVERYLSL